MKLYFGNDVAEVELITKVTSKVRVNFMRELSNLKQDPKTEKIIEVAKESGLTINGLSENTTLGSMLEFNDLQKQALDTEVIEYNDKIYCNLCKLIINKSKLTDLQIKELDKEEFWDEQDMNEIIKGVVSFRSGFAV
jgi:hypothetical protein